MQFYLMAQGFEAWGSMTMGSLEESTKFDTKSMKAIMSTLSDLVKVNIGQCSSTKSLWEGLHKIYTKEFAFVLAIPDPKHKINHESKEVDEGTNCIKKDDDENNYEVKFEIDLKEKLVAALKEISKLKKENEEFKAQVYHVDHDLDKTKE